MVEKGRFLGGERPKTPKGAAFDKFRKRLKKEKGS